MASDSHPNRQRLMEEYGISHLFESTPEKRPASLHGVFSRIKQLFNLEYEAWRDDVYQDSSRPWRKATKSRADSIVERARRLTDKASETNESTWRHTLEHDIFRRFRVEVTCRECTGRLWRSDFENPTDSKVAMLNGLQDRQNLRHKCHCNSEAPYAEPRDLPNPIFGWKADPQIVYDAQLSTKLKKKCEKPDEIIGLQRAGRIKSHLFSKDVRHESGGRTLRTRIRTSPIRNDTMTLFPFLLCESKSAKSGAAQATVNAQSAFQVRECLIVQHELEQASSCREEIGFEPLVWSLSHRGETWVVSAAYLANRRNEIPEVVIERLWVGDITTSDGALRLVLILDFVFDWARDDYREQIIAQLNRLTALPASVRASPSLTIASFHAMKARNRSASTHYHSKQPQSPVPPADPGQTRTQHERSERFGVQDPFAGTLLPSTQFQRIESWNDKNVSEQSEASAVTQETEASDPLRRHDTDECAFRDAQYIRSQLMGLLITQDNIMELFHSKDTDSKSRHLLRCIVARIQSEKMVLIRGEDLLAMEKAWSGTGSRQRADINESETFHTLITFSAYLNHKWDQTRELCYLAISVGALSALSILAKSEIRSSVSQTSFEADSELIGSIVEAFQEAAITANLTACLYRCSLSPNFSDVDDADNIFKSKSNLTPCSMDPHSKAKSRDLVWSIYRYHRIGRTEPSAPYLRVSSRVDAQRVTSRPTSTDTGTPWTTYNISDAVFLVYNKSPKGLPASPEWCIFFPDIHQLDKLLSDICLNDYRLCHGYQTYRLGPDPGWKITWWNHTYEKIGRDLHQTSKVHIEALRAALQHHEDSGLGDVDSELVGEVSTLGIQSDYGCEDSSHVDSTDENDSDATETTTSYPKCNRRGCCERL